MYRNAGMDIFLATSRYGQGLGTEAIRLLAHQHTRDPRLRTGGLRRFRIMRSYERGPDGSWHDGLLMDMLAEELRP